MTTSYQNFIQTISESALFNLKTAENTYVRTGFITIAGNRIPILEINSIASQQPTSFFLRAASNSDNFTLFVETRDNKQYPVNPITDIDTGAIYLQVDSNVNGSALQINPQAINQSGVVVKSAKFTAVITGVPTIKVDEFNRLRLNGAYPEPSFGFEVILPKIDTNTVANWRAIRGFFINPGDPLLITILQLESDRNNGLSRTQIVRISLAASTVALAFGTAISIAFIIVIGLIFAIPSGGTSLVLALVSASGILLLGSAATISTAIALLLSVIPGIFPE